MKNVKRAYSTLLKLYPPSYQKAFGEQSMQTFIDSCEDTIQSEGRVGFVFLHAMFTDEVKNIATQHLISFSERNDFLRLTVSKLVVSASIILPMYVVSFFINVKISLGLAHPAVSGLGVVLALAMLLFVSGVLSVVVSYVLASAVVCLFSKRIVRIA